MAGQNLAAMETQFTQAVDRLYEKSLDLNVSPSDVALAANNMQNLRTRLLGLYGMAVAAPVPAVGGAKAVAPAAAPAAAAAAGTGPVPWVAKLNEVMVKKVKRSLIKGEIGYTTEADETGKSFVSTVSSALLQGEYRTAAPCASKKAAEHAAARAAIEAEFPDSLAALTATGGAAAAAPVSGQKRKATGEPSAGPPEGKSQLGYFMCMILQRPITKDDIIYEVEDQGNGSFAATVKLSTYQGSPSYTGEGATRKEAEMNAAKSACAKLEPVVTPVIQEHKAKKAAKNKETLEKLKAADKAKKAANAAAKEAAEAASN